MKLIRLLSPEQMTRRIRLFVPELDSTLVCAYLRSQASSSLLETNLHVWVRFFDRFVIDERRCFSDDGSSQE